MAQQLSLKHSTSSGQWHLVPAAPEACQFLPFRSQMTQQKAGKITIPIQVVALASSPGTAERAAWRRQALSYTKKAQISCESSCSKNSMPISTGRRWEFEFSQCAPRIRRMHEPHDLPHILPSVKGPEELRGSILSPAYLNGPASFRILSHSKTREIRITVP